MHETIIRTKLDLLRGKTVVRRLPTGPWEARLAHYAGPGHYETEHDWAPLESYRGFPALKTVFLRCAVDIPELHDPGTSLYLDFQGRGLEGLVLVDGRAYAGLDPQHQRVAAPSPGTHELLIEAMCQLHAYYHPEARHELAVYSGLSLAEVDSAIEALYFDLLFLWETSRVVREPRRRSLLEAALEDALLGLDLTVAAPQFRADAVRVRECLATRLRQMAPDPEGGRVYLVGHTHIDTAWLWPLRETVRKCSRTFATAVRLMERYPQFEFACSQAQLFAYTKQHYPELYEEIRKWVKAGRWHTTGAMWVEADCNVPSGESLVRQILSGLSFFKEEFGTRPRTCWLPDVFGYPGNLPQILKGCGVDYFLTCKLHWQSLNPVVSHLFWWEGIDGSRVLAHIPKLRNYYNGTPRPEELVIAWDNYLQKAEHPEVLFPFGYGDGGGGVTAEMMEFVDRAASYPGLPATRTGHEEQYFAEAARAGAGLPVWEGELYLETHRGTYTTQSRTKQANRRSEALLREAEIWSSLANAQGADLDLSPLTRAWRRVLLQQFHDILPGSSIGEVYVEALADHATAQQEARAVRDAAMLQLLRLHGGAGELCVLNPLSWDRSDPVEAVLPEPGLESFCLEDSWGRVCPVQVLERSQGTVRVLFEPPGVPALGFETFRVVRAETGPSGALRVSERQLENDTFLVELDDRGSITRLLDKRVDREVVPNGERANDWQLFQDGPEREAAWNIHATFEKRRYPVTEPAEMRIVESGPVRVAIQVLQRYRGSLLGYRIAIYRQTPRLDILADADWQERQVLLKAAFPVTVRHPQATYEVQYGAIQRPTHRNTSWEQQKFEVAAQRWADLSEAGYGVSLLNDGRYGYDVRGHVLRLTLLRGPEYPDPEADRGRHQFGLSLYPHAGDWRTAGTVQRAWELNAPMTALALPATGQQQAGGNPARLSYVRVSPQGVLVEALKRAEDGRGSVLRLYEALGGRGLGQVTMNRPLAKVLACNLVEEDAEEVPILGQSFQFAFSPFQVRSFRLLPA